MLAYKKKGAEGKKGKIDKYFPLASFHIHMCNSRNYDLFHETTKLHVLNRKIHVAMNSSVYTVCCPNIFQTLMNVYWIKTSVPCPVLTPLVATHVAVCQASCWTKMREAVVVRMTLGVVGLTL